MTQIGRMPLEAGDAEDGDRWTMERDCSVGADLPDAAAAAVQPRANGCAQAAGAGPRNLQTPQATLDALIDAAKAERALVLLHDDRDEDPVGICWPDHAGATPVESVNLPARAWVDALHGGKSHVIVDAARIGDMDAGIAYFRRGGFASSLGLPLQSGGRVVGSLWLESAEPWVHVAPEIDALAALAAGQAEALMLLAAKVHRRHAQEELHAARAALQEVRAPRRMGDPEPTRAAERCAPPSDDLREDHERLVDEHRRLLAAIEALPHSVVIYDQNDRISLMNESYRQIYPELADVIRIGATYEEVQRAGIERGVVDAEGREDALLAEFLERHKWPAADNEIQLADGRWLRMVDRRTPDGGHVGLRIDITRLKRAEERLQNVVEGAEIGVWEWDLASGVSVVNDRWLEMAGYDGSDILAYTFEVWITLIHPDDRDRVLALVYDCTSGRSAIYEAEYRFRHRLGHWIRVQDRGRVISCSRDGSARVLAGITADVTERHRTEAKLREHDHLLKSLFDLAPIGMALLDFGSARLLNANPSLVSATGYALEELKSVRLRDLFPADLYDRTSEYLASHLAAQGRVDPMELRIKRKDGTHYPAILHAMVVEAGDGRTCFWCFIEDVTRQKAHEAALEAATRAAEAAHDRLLTAIEALPESFTYFDSGDRLVFCNSKCRELYPRSADIMVPGVTFEEIMRQGMDRGEYRDANGGHDDWLEKRTQARQAGEAMEYTTAEGRWIRVWDKKTADGGIVGLQADLTEVKRAEQTLASILSRAEVGTWEWDVTTDEVAINLQWADMLGYSLEEIGVLTNKGFFEMMHPDDRKPIREADHVIRAGGDDTFEDIFRMRHKSGRWVSVLSRGGVVARGPDGSVTKISGVHIDVTTQQEREAALEAARLDLQRALDERDTAEKRFFDIAAVSNDWFWEQDTDLRFTYFSENARSIIGDPLQAVGETWSRFHPHCVGCGCGGDWEGLARQMQARAPISNFVFSVCPEGGREPQWLRISGAPVFNPAGVFRGYRGVGSDVTEAYLAKERAEEASRTKSLFLANMSHEIRTPLNGVLGMAEILDGVINDPEKKRMIGIIRESGESLLRILNDILDISKIEAGKLELEEEAFKISDLAYRTADLHALKAEEKGLAFEVLVGSGGDRLRLGDPGRVRQILNNLLSNAIKFTEIGEVMALISARPGKPLTIEVRDTGVGMTKAEAAKLFQDFTQADSSITRRFGGTGLGLSIVGRLVKAMGGEVSIESAPGEGTSVRVSLPLPDVVAMASSSQQPIAGREVADISGVRALVADDNGTNRQILAEMLTHQGATLTKVQNGAEAVEAWKPGAFDVLLLDISMPVMDGVTALQKIREREAAEGAGATPAIAVTANAMAHQVVEYIAAGFDAHLSKPIKSADLAKAIATLLMPR